MANDNTNSNFNADFAAASQAFAASMSSVMASKSFHADRKFAREENEKNRQFNAEQAELARNFNAAEAEKARQFSEDFYNQYQSPSALVNQYKSAGLNPALMYNAASSPSANPSSAAASGPAASGSAPATPPSYSENFRNVAGSFAELTQMVRAAQLLGAEKRQKQAETELALANTAKAQADTIGQQILNGYTPSLKDAELRNMQVQADAALSTIRLNDSATELNASQRALVASKVLTESENQEHIRSLMKSEVAQRDIMAYQKELITAQIKAAQEGVQLTRAQISEIAHRNNLTDKQAAHCDKLMHQVDKTIESLGVDIKQKELDFSKSQDLFLIDVARAKVELYDSMFTKVFGNSALPYDTDFLDKYVDEYLSKSSRAGGAR